MNAPIPPQRQPTRLPADSSRSSITTCAAVLGILGLIGVLVGFTPDTGISGLAFTIGGAVLVGSAGVMLAIGWAVEARRYDARYGVQPKR